MPYRPAALVLALLLIAGCAPRQRGAVPAPAKGTPIEVARFLDVRGGTGVAAPNTRWFQQRMGTALAREGFSPKLLAHDESPSGEGLSVTGRLEELPSTVEMDGPPGEVAFRVEVRRNGEVLLSRAYQNRVWLGWPQMMEWGTAESALRQAVDQALADFARDVRRVSAQQPSQAPAPPPP